MQTVGSFCLGALVMGSMATLTLSVAEFIKPGRSMQGGFEAMRGRFLLLTIAGVALIRFMWWVVTDHG